jgi:hypothetical protein
LTKQIETFPVTEPRLARGLLLPRAATIGVPSVRSSRPQSGHHPAQVEPPAAG